MSFFLRFRNPDENSMRWYLCELFFENCLDIPQNIERWSKEKLASRIVKYERKYGPAINY